MSDLPLLGQRTASQENNIFMAKRQFYRPERPWEVSSVHPSLTFIPAVERFTWKYLLDLNTIHFVCLIWLCLLSLTTKGQHFNLKSQSICVLRKTVENMIITVDQRSRCLGCPWAKHYLEKALITLSVILRTADARGLSVPKSLLTKGRELNKCFFGLCSKDCKNIHIKDDKLLSNYVTRRPLVQE